MGPAGACSVSTGIVRVDGQHRKAVYPCAHRRAERHMLALEGAFNFRDLGELATHNGRTAGCGRLFAATHYRRRRGRTWRALCGPLAAVLDIREARALRVLAALPRSSGGLAATALRSRGTTRSGAFFPNSTSGMAAPGAGHCTTDCAPSRWRTWSGSCWLRHAMAGKRFRVLPTATFPQVRATWFA